MQKSTLLLLALLVLTPALFLRPPSRQQELRVLITGRNMLESGDPFRPEFQNQPRFRKPPLAYWLAASSMGLSGIHNEAWAARLPFAAAALGCFALLLRLGGPSGPWAALLFLFSFGFWRYAPLAETDILQLFGILLTFHAYRERQGWLCGLAISIAFLAKGPAAIAIPLTTALLAKLLAPHSSLNTRHSSLVTRHSTFLLSLLLLPLLTGGAWLLFLFLDPIARDALSRELRDTFVNSPHVNPWYYYFYTGPLMLLPGLLLLLPAFRRKASTPARLSLPHAWFLATFLLLSLVDSKQRHYALLLLPPACLLLGDVLHRRGLSPRLRIALPLALLLALAEIPRAQHDPWNRHRTFLREARRTLSETATLHVAGINSAFFDFHLGRHVENTDSARDAITRAHPGDAVFILQKREHFDAADLALAPLAAADDAHWIRRAYASPLPKP